MKPPRIVKNEVTAVQELLGAISIVGAVFIASMSGMFGLIRLMGKGLKGLSNLFLKKNFN